MKPVPSKNRSLIRTVKRSTHCTEVQSGPLQALINIPPLHGLSSPFFKKNHRHDMAFKYGHHHSPKVVLKSIRHSGDCSSRNTKSGISDSPGLPEGTRDYTSFHTRMNTRSPDPSGFQWNDIAPFPGVIMIQKGRGLLLQLLTHT